jgi:hypothetical protein
MLVIGHGKRRRGIGFEDGTTRIYGDAAEQAPAFGDQRTPSPWVAGRVDETCRSGTDDEIVAVELNAAQNMRGRIVMRDAHANEANVATGMRRSKAALDGRSDYERVESNCLGR